jgi:cytoplasmic iron level regulating protein YaaA (DUF328/UPF0246 family)
MKRIVLIACASKKKPYKTQAADLYDSELFRRSLAYARRLRPDAIYILSAKYGLLDPQEVIEPYNVTLNTMPAGEIRAWAGRVLAQLRSKADLRHDHFIILAGDKYRRYVLPHLASYELPLEGLPIGKQLQFLGPAT